MRKIILFLVFGLGILSGSFTNFEDKRTKLDTIVIDAGHGGSDPGCHGAISNEKDVSLAVALELGAIINEYLPDVKVIFTRDKDEFMKLNDRAMLANNKKADLFVSIHCNSGNPVAFGTETYTMGIHNSTGTTQNFDEVAKRENDVILLEDDYKENYDGFDPSSPMTYILLAQYKQAYHNNSINLATKIEHQFKSRVGRHSRGVKQKGLWVLWKSYMPSVLIELGFLTNKNEEYYLNNKVNQSYMASGIFRAIRDYKEEIEQNNN